ncbi:MAG: hypothetical protein JW889_01640 [Verrucomicrobia bacterium]|nr:hypothetical protein [Verrucomicrobiota bacterium]
MNVGAVLEPQSYLPVGLIHRRPTTAPIAAVSSRRSSGADASAQLEEDPGPKLLVDLNLIAPRPVDQRRSARLDPTASTERTDGCKTCARRKYQDRSDDPSVSFQTPTSVSPAQAETLVRAHEAEHVQHERTKAAREGKDVDTRVSIHYSTCPECGRVYCSGGTTHVETREPAHGSLDPEPSAAAARVSGSAPANVSPSPAGSMLAVDLVA